MKYLIIDGNYFSMRALGQLNMKSSKNDLQTPAECQMFENCLKNNLYNIYRTFNNDVHSYIDAIIIVRDGHSWRKDIPPVKPYYLTDDTKYGYKEQRIKVRDDSTINYDNFYLIHNTVFNDIRAAQIPGVHIIDHPHLEGDDIICYLSDRFKSSTTDEFYVFCTDSDLCQTVRDNFTLIRNIRSKEAPNGEIVVSVNNYSEYHQSIKTVDGEDAFLTTQKPINPIYKVMIGDLKGNQKVTRPIKPATPFVDIVYKAICGEPGDNLFPIIKWSSNSRQYRVTPKMVDRAIYKLGLSPSTNLTNRVAFDVLKNTDRLKLVIIELMRSTPSNLDIQMQKTLIGHLNHNLAMIILTVKAIPTDYIKELTDIVDSLDLTQTVDNELFDTITKVGTERNDMTSINDIFTESLPDGLDDWLKDSGIELISSQKI